MPSFNKFSVLLFIVCPEREVPPLSDQLSNRGSNADKWTNDLK